MRNALTVDVEEWFHICGVGGPLAPDRWDVLPSRVVANTRDLFALFERAGVRATFFFLGWVAERHPELVAEAIRQGHEIGSHGSRHTRVYEMTPEEFGADLDRAEHALNAAGASNIAGFRAPEWSINDRSLWAIDILARKGYRFDSSMTPLRIIGNPAYPQTPHERRTAGGTILEFPPMVARRWGQNMPLGGGWGLRMSRPAAILNAIESRNRDGAPVALFVHPWEIDPDPPRMALPLARRFAHYFKLGGFKARLEDVLRGGSFAPMGEVLGLAP